MGAGTTLASDERSFPSAQMTTATITTKAMPRRMARIPWTGPIGRTPRGSCDNTPSKKGS